MRLTMAIGEKVIDSVSVEPHRCKQEGYLRAMQRCLKLKHLDEIVKTSKKPIFYLQTASGMNGDTKTKK